MKRLKFQDVIFSKRFLSLANKTFYRICDRLYNFYNTIIRKTYFEIGEPFEYYSVNVDFEMSK